MDLEQANLLATVAHQHQSDKLGEPYVLHVQAVAEGLKSFPLHVQIAGLLHDVVEDTDWGLGCLREMQVPEESIKIVDAMTKQPDSTRRQQIQRVIEGGPEAVLVKISDNAHNSHPTRLAGLDEATRSRLEGKYRDARSELWKHASPGDIKEIISVVNPSLLAELKELESSDVR